MLLVILQHVTFYWSEITAIQHGTTVTFYIEHSNQCCSISQTYSHVYFANIHNMIYNSGFINKATNKMYKLILLPSHINNCDVRVAHILDLSLSLYTPFVEINVLHVFLLQSIFFIFEFSILYW